MTKPTRTQTTGTEPQFDVVILGSGLSGSMLAAVLARHSARVLVVDAGTHPRFAVGESTIPYTSMMMRLVSERYDVPEIKYLTTFENVQSKITNTCGIKRNFGFVYHREGARQNPLEAHEFPIAKVTHTENHFFRQHIDAWMLNVAVGYGAKVKQQARVTGIEVDDTGVTLATDRAGAIRARYVVDASGYRSPLAQQFGLREEPTRLRHHSRSLFTHMVGVTPYEDTVEPRRAHKNPSPWSQGTLHHVFEGGWIWVIPFNNHPRSTNPLCSVGLSLDPRVHPKPDCPPEQEFREFIARFPDMGKQFKPARSVREWVSTGRLQYSSSSTVGYRWCLTSHASGFIDALFSRGLTNTLEIINALSCRLLDALRDDDFSVERFEYVQRLEQGLLDFNDDLVANAYTSFQEFSLWDAWFRIWTLSTALATFEINRAYARFLEHHDPTALARVERLAPEGSITDYPPARRLLQAASERVRAVQDHHADPVAAGDDIITLFRQADFIPPVFRLADRSHRWSDATLRRVALTLLWTKTSAPPQIGELTREGLLLFLRKRLSPDEFNVIEELKHVIARWPLVGRPLRVPAPLTGSDSTQSQIAVARSAS